MQRNLSIILFILFSMLFAFSESGSNAFTLNDTTPSIVKNDSWISERNNLNVSIKLEPIVPVIRNYKNII
jgi:hypothetical protein